jgi:hypothetical protein
MTARMENDRLAPKWEAALACGFLLLVVASKLAVLDTPYYWDEILWIRFTHDLAARPLWQVLPGLHEGFPFGNRLPGLFLPMAALFKLTGPSIVVAHAAILCFAFAGVWFTHRLASLWFGPVAGVLAALFLFLSAPYFAQSAMFLADLPAAATAVTTVYFGVRRRFAPYWACASYLVLLKEPVVSVVCALAAWAFLLKARASVGAALADAARYAAPVLLVALYYGWQWLATGYPLAHYTYGFEPFAPGLDAALDQLPRVHRWLLVEQGRWVFSLLILAGLTRRSFRRVELLLIALIVLGAGYCYALLYFLPRYLLPVAPFFFIAGAGALVALVRSKPLALAAGALLVGLLVAHLEARPGHGNREWDMGYLRVVRIHQEAAAFLEREFPDASVEAGFPLISVLSRPELGYVRQPLRVFHDAAGTAEPDLIVAGSPGLTDPLAAAAERRGLERVRRFGDGDLAVTIYAGGSRPTVRP